MKKYLFTIWTVLLISMLAISPVYAGGVSGKWGQGSITFEGYAFGFSRGEVTITIHAIGNPVVTCTKDGNSIPGEDPDSVKGGVSATYEVVADKNGKFAVSLEAPPDLSGLSPVDLGCPTNEWVPTVDWVDWYYTSITVIENSTKKLLFFKENNCTSTETTVDCTPIK